MTHNYKWLFKPTVPNILYLCAGIIVNIVISTLTHRLGAPFWLNSIGTVFCSCLLGPLGGSLTGIVSVILCHAATPVIWLYGICCIPISVFVSILYQRTGLHDAFQLVCTSIITMMLTVINAVPLDMIVQDGYSGNLWGNALVDMLRQTGNNSLFCCILAQFFIELPDKIITVFTAAFLVRLVNLGSQHQNGRGRTK